MIGGMFCRCLRVDLTRYAWTVEEIPASVVATVVGGKGLGTYLLQRLVHQGTDPLGPDNPLIFTVGPATDTEIMGCSRYGVYSRSPLTGFYGESYAGGKVAAAIKRTGFDAIIIEGRSTTPTYLEISPDDVRFRDASHIWGLDTADAEATVLREISVKGAQAIVIGPAGENLVKFAVLENNRWRSAGRTGMGAVMGSKKLKAVVVYGDRHATVADADFLGEIAQRILERAKNDPGVKSYRDYGTPALVAVTNKANCFPSYYWSKGNVPWWENISAQALRRSFEVRSRACPRCYIACGKLTTVREGKWKGITIEGPEYETIYAFGGLCGVRNLEDIIYLNDVCDRLGLDTISAGNIVGLAIEAWRRRKIDFCIDYGDTERIADLLGMISQRKGIGAVFADGIAAAASALDLEDLAIHVKGLEPAGYDPRVLKGMALAYATSPRGACHLRTTFYKPELSGVIAPEVVEGKAELLIDYEDRMALFDSLIMCRFLRDLVGWEDLSAIVRSTLGLEVSAQQLRRRAAAIVDATRVFNLTLGLKREHDLLPKRFYQEPIGPSSLTEKEFHYMLSEYYRLRGWDREGRPIAPTAESPLGGEAV